MPALEAEFVTVSLVLNSDAQTCGVDAFCLAWIKFERQLRKLTANTIYQASVFDDSDCKAKDELPAVLLDKKTSNYGSFLSAIRILSGEDLRLLTKDQAENRHQYLWHSIDVAHRRRNKILHGLQTGESLSRDALKVQVNEIKEVCQLISIAGQQYLGYDGVSRDSLRKNGRPKITDAVDKAMAEGGWKTFLARRL